MEATDIRALREWSPLTDVFAKIPLKVQKGFFFVELNVTCIDALDEYLALGTDAGIVYWYNRQNGNVQKLRTESMTSITCIRVISSVEYMIAVGSVCGEVSVFQIQKELPKDLIRDEIVAALRKSRPIERYTIRHTVSRAAITCVEWSKNGMKLFSGDAAGVVILSEFDFGRHQSRSTEILNEAYHIVQMGFMHPCLIVSTVYRAVVCVKADAGDKWDISQIGKTDRKVLNKFGVMFKAPTIPSSSSAAAASTLTRQPSIICSRPGFRFWLADTDGNVSHTFLLKDSIMQEAISYQVPLLNPFHGKLIDMRQTYFGPCHNYCGSFIITYSDSIVYIINLEELKVVATIRRLRKIQYLAINGPEIFILEHGRSIVRLAPTPDQMGKWPQASHGDGPFVHEIDAAATIADADECLELPPIEHIQLSTPIECELNEHNLLREDKLLLEHSRKLEVFEKINGFDYDDSILFQTGTRKKKKSPKVQGIVEIGRQADSIDEPIAQHRINGEAAERNGTDHEVMTTPSLLEASFCETSSSIVPDLRSPTTFVKELAQKEEKLAKILDIPSIPSEPIPIAIDTSIPPLKPKFYYPLNYASSINRNGCSDSMSSMSNATLPLRKIHLINDEEESEEDESCDENESIPKPLSPKATNHGESDDGLPKVQKMPKFMKIPNLWDIKIENCESTDDEGDGSGAGPLTGSDGSEWEFL